MAAGVLRSQDALTCPCPDVEDEAEVSDTTLILFADPMLLDNGSDSPVAGGDPGRCPPGDSEQRESVVLRRGREESSTAFLLSTHFSGKGKGL